MASDEATTSTFDQNDSGFITKEFQACVQLSAIEIEISWHPTDMIRRIVEQHTQPDDPHDTTSQVFEFPSASLAAVTGLLKVGGSEEHSSGAAGQRRISGEATLTCQQTIVLQCGV